MAYVCGGKSFKSLEAAKGFAEAEFSKSGVVLGIEAVKKRVSKAEKLERRIAEGRISRAIVGFQIPMMSIPKLYSVLELAVALGEPDENLKKIVAGHPGVMESV